MAHADSSVLPESIPSSSVIPYKVARDRQFKRPLSNTESPPLADLSEEELRLTSFFNGSLWHHRTFSNTMKQILWCIKTEVIHMTEPEFLFMPIYPRSGLFISIVRWEPVADQRKALSQWGNYWWFQMSHWVITSNQCDTWLINGHVIFSQ